MDEGNTFCILVYKTNGISKYSCKAVLNIWRPDLLEIANVRCNIAVERSHMRWQRGQDKNSAFGKRITHGLPPTDQLVKYEAPSDHAYHTAGFFWTYQAYRQTVRAEIHRELEMVHLRSSPSRSRRYNLAVGQPRIAVSW
ncbi:uncharacterized protein LOC129143943 isoform X3 [Pan troglodytes]|uniref:uncharacterized protein LOC129143943 isoform X3 n=1 Tax=Pan troglodytes TaxID=9598 RepID=UPI003013399B